MGRVSSKKRFWLKHSKLLRNQPNDLEIDDLGNGMLCQMPDGVVENQENRWCGVNIGLSEYVWPSKTKCWNLVKSFFKSCLWYSFFWKSDYISFQMTGQVWQWGLRDMQVGPSFQSSFFLSCYLNICAFILTAHWVISWVANTNGKADNYIVTLKYFHIYYQYFPNHDRGSTRLDEGIVLPELKSKYTPC